MSCKICGDKFSTKIAFIKLSADGPQLILSQSISEKLKHLAINSKELFTVFAWCSKEIISLSLSEVKLGTVYVLIKMNYFGQEKFDTKLNH